MLRASFTVCVPAVTLPASEFVHMLTHTVERYRLAGKTYLVRIEDGKTETQTTP